MLDDSTRLAERAEVAGTMPEATDAVAKIGDWLRPASASEAGYS